MVEQSIESPYIHAANADNFTDLVIENSTQGPVLVNFWSRKAGPCLRQYPILDKLIYQYEGKVLLVNLDIDNDYQITNEYSITSVPTLKLFLNKKVVKTRHGFQSEDDLNELIQKFVVRPSDKVLAEAIHFYAQNEKEKAYELITHAIIDDPINPRLPLALCKILKHEGRYTEANKLLTSLPVEISNNPEIIELQSLIGFNIVCDKIDDIDKLIKTVAQSPENLSARKQLSAWHVVQQDYEMAIKELMNMMEINNEFEEYYPRKALLRIFSILGNDHALSKQYRNVLNQYTY